MKSILIAINVMLAILAAGEVIKCLTEKEDAMPARVSTTAKTAKETSSPIVSTPAKASPITRAIQRSPQQIEEQVNLISALNIFSSERTPDIPTAAKRATANNASAEKKLVGTFEMNGVKGAIILQRTNQRNGNRNAFGFDGGFGFGGFGFGGMGFGMDMGMNTANQNNTAQASAEEVSQAQIEDARQRLAQLQSVMQTLQRNNATADQLASITRQIEAQNTLLQQLLAIATPQDTSEDGVASISATNSNNVRQYLKLGESTADGYMLIDVTRTTATLRRNNDVIELTMQKASDNQEAMAFAASRASAAQVVVSDTPANTSSNTVASSNGGGRRNNGGFGDFGGFGGGDFGGFGGGDFGGGDFGGFGGGDGGFGGFGGGNGGFGGGNNGFGGGNGGFGGGNSNSRTNSMTGGNRAGMNSNSRATTTSASSRNTTNRSGMNNNTAGRTNNATRTNTNSATRTNTNSNAMRSNTNAGRTNSTTSRNNAAGRTGVNTGNRTGGAGMGGR